MVLRGLTPTRRNLALAAIAALLLWFLWSVRSALNPLGVGLLFAYMLHPLVTSLERRGWSRRLAVNVIFAVTAVGGVVLTLAMSLQARSLWSDMARPEGALAKIEDRLVDGAGWAYAQLERWGVGGDEPAADPDADPDAAPIEGEGDPDAETPPIREEGGDEVGEETEEAQEATGTEESAAEGQGEGTPGEAPDDGPIRLEDVFANLRAWLVEEGRLEQAGEAGLRAAGGVWSVLRRVFGSLLTFGGYLLLVPIYTWFLLFELERISAFVQRYIPRAERARFVRIGNQIAEMLGNFFRGRMLVCLLKGLVLAVVLMLAGFPYALLVGVVSGFLSLVPFVGPAFGYGLAFLLGLLEFDVVPCAIRMAIVYSIGELVEGYVLLPKVLGNSMGLHPIVVIASLMVFGAAFGVFGMLLALPLTSAAVIVARELVLPALAEVAEGRGGSDPGAGGPAAEGKTV